jgi:hypothetical protein
MSFLTKDKGYRGTTSPAASIPPSPLVVSLSSTSTESESTFEMAANSSTCEVSPSPDASTSFGSECWQIASPPRSLSRSPCSLFRRSLSPPPTEEQLLDEYGQVSVEFWPGAEDYEVEVEVEVEFEEVENVKGYASAWAIPNSPTDASVMFNFRTDDLGYADEMVENTRGLQEPVLPREHIALNAGTLFGYYAACDEEKTCKIDLTDLADEDEEDIDVLFDSEDSSTFVDWPPAPVVTLWPTSIAEQFAHLAAQDAEVEEWSEDIIPYSDDEGEEVQVQVTRMRMFDHDTKREYYVEFDAQGNMTFCFDLEVEAETNELDDEVPKLRPGDHFLPGLEHITKPFVQCVFVEDSFVDEAQAPVDVEEDQDIIHIVDAYPDPDMIADINEAGELTDITRFIHPEPETSSASSSSSEVVPKLVSDVEMNGYGKCNDITHVLHVGCGTSSIPSSRDVVRNLMPGINFLPGFEDATNPIVQSIFIEYQQASPAESAIETEDDDDNDDDDDQDILDIIDAYLDPDLLSDMVEDGEFTDITDIIRPTTYFYNADTQQESRILCHEPLAQI